MTRFEVAGSSGVRLAHYGLVSMKFSDSPTSFEAADIVKPKAKLCEPWVTM
jgi:hypothetical protein